MIGANTGTITAVHPKPRPPKTRRVTASCMLNRLVENSFGSTGTPTVTVALNAAAVYAVKRGAAALLPGPGWVYVTLATGYDAWKVYQSYSDCKNGGEHVIEETPADDQPEVEEQ